MFASLHDRDFASRVVPISSLPAEAYVRKPPQTVYYGTEETRTAYQNKYVETAERMGPRFIYRVRDATVRGSLMGVITLDGKIVRENLEGAPVQRLEQQIAQHDTPSAVIDEPVLYLSRYGVRNYGHCLTDIIPRMHWFHQQYPQVKIIVQQGMPATIIDALEHVGIGRASLLALGDETVRLRDMYFVDLWNRHPLFHSPRTFAFLARLKNLVLSNGPSAPTTRLPRKLFVSRGDAKTRRLENHAAVKSWLTARGYVEISCGELSLREQIRHFAAAEDIVAIAGAALTNMVFCQPGARILALSPSSMPSLYFWDMAHHAQSQYSVGYFPAAANSRGIHSDFSVDVDVLAQMLAA